MLLLLVTSLVVGSRCFAVSVTTDPCGGSNRVPGIVAVNEDVVVGVADVRELAIEARDSASRAQLLYTSIRISDYTQRRLSEISLENFPSQRNHFENSLTLGKLQHDYNSLSAMAVFVDVVYSNTSTDIYYPATDNQPFLNAISNFRHAVNQLLCKLYLLSQTMGFELEQNVQESVMLAWYKTGSRSFFNERDYIVFRDSTRYLSAMASDY